MSVNTFDPKGSNSESHSDNQTTTMETPNKIIAEQAPSSEQETSKQGSGRVGFVSLGCPKNTVDSERILTQLKTEGYEISPSYDDADVVLVNTCGFIDSAVQESLDTIGEAIRGKRQSNRYWLPRC